MRVDILGCLAAIELGLTYAPYPTIAHELD